MREIVFDTETTGFKFSEGDRLVEIGCVELIDHFPTGKSFQAYLNPEREVPIESQRVHGLSNEFLSDKPLFAHVVEGLDVIKAILIAPKSPTKGEGVMKGQMLETPVNILSVRRTP